MWNLCCLCSVRCHNDFSFVFFGKKEMKRMERTVIFQSGSACVLSCHFIAGFSSEVCTVDGPDLALTCCWAENPCGTLLNHMSSLRLTETNISLCLGVTK